jgi:hypothetical protein
MSKKPAFEIMLVVRGSALRGGAIVAIVSALVAALVSTLLKG